MAVAGHAVAFTRSSDEELVRASVDGSEDAWAALIHRYKNLIYAVPLRAGASREEAAQIFHDVCLNLFAELSHLQRITCLRTWLLTAAAQKLCEFREQQRQLVESPDAAARARASEIAILPPNVLEQIDCDQRVRETVEQLPDRCRRLVQLLFYEHPPRPYGAVAPQLGLATGSIGFIRGRCLVQLARSLRADNHRPAPASLTRQP